jgi:hypothetical protein
VETTCTCSTRRRSPKNSSEPADPRGRRLANALCTEYGVATLRRDPLGRPAVSGGRRVANALCTEYGVATLRRDPLGRPAVSGGRRLANALCTEYGVATLLCDPLGRPAVSGSPGLGSRRSFLGAALPGLRAQGLLAGEFDALVPPAERGRSRGHVHGDIHLGVARVKHVGQQ